MNTAAAVTHQHTNGGSGLLTLPQIAALAGRKIPSVTTALRKVPAPSTVMQGGKTVPAWPVEGLPPMLRCAVRDTLERLAPSADCASAFAVPGESQPNPRKRRNFSVRPDATLLNFPDAHKEEIFKWLAGENITYADAVTRINHVFGVKVSHAVVAKFFQRYCAPRLLKKPPPAILGEVRVQFLSEGGAKIQFIGPSQA